MRELENEIRRAVALAEEDGDITPDLFSEAVGHAVSDVSVEYHLPAQADARPQAGGRLQDRMQEYERRLIRDALERYKGNITHTAKELGVARISLYRKINRLGLR